MALYKLNAEQEKTFAGLGESGMGFQVVWLRRAEAGPVERYVVVDTCIVLPASSAEMLQESLDELAQATSGLLSSDQAGDATIEDIPADPFEYAGGVSVTEQLLPIAAVGTAPPAPAYQPPLLARTALVIHRASPSPAAYVRYSSRKKDPRISPNGDFSAGTYAAPWSEVPFIQSGFAAVGRLALPNPFPARWVHPIVTQADHWVGAVAPNFAQAGGGVEVIFPTGARALHQEPHVIPPF